MDFGMMVLVLSAYCFVVRAVVELGRRHCAQIMLEMEPTQIQSDIQATNFERIFHPESWLQSRFDLSHPRDCRSRTSRYRHLILRSKRAIPCP